MYVNVCYLSAKTSKLPALLKATLHVSFTTLPPTFLQVAIYQITDSGICDQLLKLHKAGVNVSIIVSARIVSYTDWKLAQDCYGSLYDGGMKGSIRKALTKFSFAHQKYWIIDGKSVHLSTGEPFFKKITLTP